MDTPNWLLSNLRPSYTTFVYMSDILKRCHEETAIHLSTRKMHLQLFSVFAGINKGKRRFNTLTGHSETIYNLEWTTKNLSKVDPLTFKLPDHCSVLKREQNCFKFNVPTNILINNATLYKKVILSNDKWCISTLEKSICPSSVGLDPNFDWSVTRLLSILQIVDNLKICLGVSLPPNSLPPVNSKVQDILIKGDENIKPLVSVRNNNCFYFLCHESASDKCYHCKTMTFKIDHNNTESNEKKNYILLDNEESSDLQQILKSILNLDMPKNMKTLMLTQLRSIDVSPNLHRWDPEIISTALSLYCRSPKAYKELCDGGFINLPSGRLLRYYKNCCNQSPGFNDDVLSWMQQEAIRLKLPNEAWYGGILVDEMAIQQDLQIVKKGKSMFLIGNVDIGELGNLADRISSNENKCELAKSVLQFVFLGHTGYRFPILYFTFWEGVDKLEEYGFQAEYVSTDGAVANRQFLKLHFEEDPKKFQFKAKSPINPNKYMIFIMDVKHNIKKIRNGLLKSDGQSKCIMVSGKEVLWKHFEEAHVFNDSKIWKVHKNLCSDHFDLSGPSKMRNKLAEEVLDKEMLYLFTELKKSKSDKERNCTDYDGYIELVGITSKLVNFAQDKRPLNLKDIRIDTLHDILNFFSGWNDCANNKSKLSQECMEDMLSYLYGIIELYKLVSSRGHFVLVPARLNSDPVENIFCQQRGICNGLNTNPTYAAYGPATNTIISSQTAISKKSNTGGQCMTQPYKFIKPKKQRKQEKQTKPLRL